MVIRENYDTPVLIDSDISSFSGICESRRFVFFL